MKSNIKRILKKLGKANFTSIMFAVVSIISTTFAWFAFSNVVDSDMEINVRSWKIDISEGESQITNKLKIDLDEFYPGIDMVSKNFSISNSGDIDSVVSYKIKSLRIYNEEFDLENQDLLFDKLAQEYPFTMNFNLSKEFLGVGEEVEFSYSIAWPLDSGDDNADALWGNRAYDFAVAEQAKKKNDSSYEIRPSISIDVELTVEQFVSDGTNDYDTRYSSGTKKHLNIYDYSQCDENEIIHCNDFYVIEKNNLKSSTTVKMFPSPDHLFSPQSYDGTLNIIDSVTFLDLISSDVEGTRLVIPGLSDRIVGFANDKSYYNGVLKRMIDNNGYIKFSKSKFPSLVGPVCYWVKDSNYPRLAVSSLDSNTLQFGYIQNESCYNVPLINYTK